MIHGSMSCPHQRCTRVYVVRNVDGEVQADPSEPDELFARLVSLENEKVQARQRSSSATEVTDTRTLGKTKSSTGYAAECTTWQ